MNKKYSFCFLLALSTLLMLFVITLTQCSPGVDPPEDQPNQPGRRDYVWSVDTILNYAYMNKLWGSSPTDVWAIGQPGNFSKSIWHFDGVQWTTDGIFRFFVPHSIWGFAKNDIYIGAMNGEIWQYDESGWKQTAKLTKDGSTQIVFDNMWGDSPNSLFAFGAYTDANYLYNNSVIAHYTNNNWIMLNTDGLTGIVERFYKNKTDGKFYIQTYKIGGGQYPDSTLIYEYTQGKYNKIYGSIWTHGQQADISLINGEVYFVLGSEIAKRINNQFQTYLKVDNPNFYQRIWGRNSKDIFLLMTDGLAHYNGTNIEYLFYFNRLRTQIPIGGVTLFNDEVFFLAAESQTGLYLIYHGKLN